MSFALLKTKEMKIFLQLKTTLSLSQQMNIKNLLLCFIFDKLTDM